jgi:4-alpha-glucanotransferase
LATDGREINWVLIRALMQSVADTVLFPFQDVLGLGSDARMNLPATSSGNWRWRFCWHMLEPAHAARLALRGKAPGDGHGQRALI